MLRQLEINEREERRETKRYERMVGYAVMVTIIALAIMMFGLTMLYSASYATRGSAYFIAQSVWAVISVIAMIAVIFFGYRRIGNWSKWLMLLLIVLLIAAIFGPPINGAHRWIALNLGGRDLRFQPSEMAKPVLALFAAKALSDHFRQVGDWKQWRIFIKPFALVGLTLLLVLAGRDLGTTALLGGGMFVLIVLSGIQKRFWIVPLLAGAALLYTVVQISPVRMARVTSFMDPERFSDDNGYQLWHSLLALGSGDWSGLGFMESKMKLLYLPESHTDFILAVCGEELGFIGMTGVILGYLLLGWFGFKVALGAHSRYGMLLAGTLTATILLQAAINIGVVAGALPTKGIPAPLISYGGSNLLMTMIMVGLIVSVALESIPGLTDNWWGRSAPAEPGSDNL